MKKLQKLFMAVAAVAAVGCTTDVTEDLGVNLNEGQTTLTLSLDDTRTQLGEKADGIYPLTWAEGDAISVNGHASKALTANEAGAASATFTFNGGFGSAPYFVAYPAVEGTTNQVVFAAEQTHVSNTSFGNNATVIYGYATELNSVKLNHLTGVLKIGLVSGTATPAFIKEVRISTVDRKPIAGTFSVDEEGKLTPVKTADVITYKSESDAGFILLPAAENNPVTYIHVTVPAGVYGELYVTLESADGVMYKTVTTDSTKPLNAGKVREFSSDIAFVPVAETETFVIADYSDLYEFKEAVEGAQSIIDNAEATEDAKAEATATLAKSAVFVNDVAMPVVGDVNYPAWESINAPSYTGTITGNGYAIKGLYAPLFNKTAASFKGLHLVASVEEESNPNFGAFARQLVANGNAPTVEHCSVSGTITMKTAIKPSASNHTQAAMGAFTGIAKGVHFENCVNNAAINIQSVTATDATTETSCPVSGFVGYADVANNIFVSFTNCENKGDITFVSGEQPKSNYYAGGLVAVYRGASAVTTFDNCGNSGDITMNANIGSFNAGGIIGYSNGTAENPKTFTFSTKTFNSGNITKAGTTSLVTRIGGILGYLDNFVTAIFDGPVTNSGAITFSGNQTGESVNIAGIIGHMNTEGCKATFNNTVTNTETADISITGAMTSNLYCGGLIGRTYRKNNACVITFSGKTATNNGDIYIKTNPGNTSYIGGIIGYTYLTFTKFGGNCKVLNNGPITIDNSTFKSMYVGGVWAIVNGGGSSVVSDSSKGMMANTADITFSGKTTGNCYIGGIAGYHNLGTSVPAIQTGNLNITATFDATMSIQVGGAYGQHRGGLTESKITMQNAQVYCDIVAYSTTKNSDGTYTFTPYNQVGIFSGQSSIDTIKNNKVGGRIALGGTVENGVVSHDWITMTSENYISYLLGLRDYQTNTQTNNTLLTSEKQIDWGNYGN
ncbi:MAG: hypothetical protein E7140_03580 [Rikenellaceae bacterium]|nr:hypothetical protein [Rikenellaceae bacterium]